jgi:hypothetical protein
MKFKTGANMVALLIRVPRSMRDEIRFASHAKGMNATEFIRDCISRGLDFFHRVERHRVIEQLQRLDGRTEAGTSAV